MRGWSGRHSSYSSLWASLAASGNLFSLLATSTAAFKPPSFPWKFFVASSSARCCCCCWSCVVLSSPPSLKLACLTEPSNDIIVVHASVRELPATTTLSSVLSSTCVGEWEYQGQQNRPYRQNQGQRRGYNYNQQNQYTRRTQKGITSQGNCTKAITRTPDIMCTREKMRMEIQDGHKAKKKKEIIDNNSISTGTITDNGVKTQETDETTTLKEDNSPRIKDKEKLKEGRDTHQDHQMR